MYAPCSSPRPNSTGASTAEGTQACLVLREQLQRDEGGRPTAAPGQLQRELAIPVWLIKRHLWLYTSSLRRQEGRRVDDCGIRVLSPFTFLLGHGGPDSTFSIRAHECGFVSTE
ncbi:unnamed protein product [Ectocarpus sp. 8 AP-2014]